MKLIGFLFFLFFSCTFIQAYEKGKNRFPIVGSDFIFSDLKEGDSRKAVMDKLRNAGFIQIYEERDQGVVRCAVRWDGLRYELVSKLVEDTLELCLIEGNKGWQDFPFKEVGSEEWKNYNDKSHYDIAEIELGLEFKKSPKTIKK